MDFMKLFICLGHYVNIRWTQRMFSALPVWLLKVGNNLSVWGMCDVTAGPLNHVTGLWRNGAADQHLSEKSHTFLGLCEACSWENDTKDYTHTLNCTVYTKYLKLGRSMDKWPGLTCCWDPIRQISGTRLSALSHTEKSHTESDRTLCFTRLKMTEKVILGAEADATVHWVNNILSGLFYSLKPGFFVKI